ncbi:MAG TPA: lamin tail domain-containing protein [Tepidisphaeraceae bacterium]|nr:lamin tail domain-containing protein [Tepidisphaeraceae bacterium]
MAFWPIRRSRVAALSCAVQSLEPRRLLAGDVVISELMAVNNRTLRDADGDFSDWIEVHNTTAAPVNLAGWHLTDDDLDLDKWTFPSVNLGPDGYLVVFASDKDRAVAGQQLHTNFKLDGSGDYLALVMPDGVTVTSEYDPFPRQQSDTSWGLGAESRETNPFIQAPADARYHLPTSDALGAAWVQPDFDDASWFPALTGLGFEQAAGALPAEVEPNQSPASANDASGNFSQLVGSELYQSIVTGTIGIGGDFDFFNLGALQSGDRLTATLSGTISSRGTLIDPYVELYRLNNNPSNPLLVAQSDDDGPGLDSALHRYTVTVNDVYIIKARGFNTDYTGEYDLGLYVENALGTVPPSTATPFTRESEPNNTAAGANIASGSWRRVDYRSVTTGTIDAGDEDVYRYTFAAGDVVTVIADSTSTLDAAVSLLDATGAVIASEDGSTVPRTPFESDGFDSRVQSFAIPAGGSYYVRVTNAVPSSGPYRLEVNLSSSARPTGASFSGLIATDVEEMRQIGPAAYVRVPFTLEEADVSMIDRLLLSVRYDDGFVAYLNGAEIARRNAPDDVTYASTASTGRPNPAAALPETIDLGSFRDRLVIGENVLAFHALNVSTADPDFLLYPELVALGAPLPTPTGYFSAPTPGAPNGPIDVEGIVGDTQFSHDRGFYDAPFQLAITTPTEGAQIRYTTNGQPPTATTGTVYTGPITIDRTTTIRAAAFKPGWVPTNVDTQTYLFTADIIRQSPTGQPPAGWPTSWGQNVRDYGMDPDVVNNPQYRDTIQQDLKTIPSFSIVMKLDDLFHPQTGIYSNPGQDGRPWERPASIELINPDGSRGFQSDIGLRLRGGFSRSTSNPKHGFRVFFRSEYGEGQLNYPLFGPDAANSFDGFDLRTFQNYSWSFSGDARGIFMRDVLSRDLQLAMNHPAERGDYYHLYLNGVYWGLFNTAERPEASYGATYFGGKEEDYDVIKPDRDTNYVIEATDGDLLAWTQLWDILNDPGAITNEQYQRVQGNNPDGTPNPNLPVLLDVDNLIDYMLVIFYGGNLDAPVSAFLSERPNNFFAVRNRTLEARQGFRFFVHDAEHTLLNVGEDRTGPFLGSGSTVGGSNPHYFFARLATNPEMKLRVADRVHKHFFNGGVLTPEKVREALLRRKEEIDRAVVGESARWGDSKVPTAPFTRNVHWLNEVNRILTGYIPGRTNTVLGQLRVDQLYPAVANGAPVFGRFGGTVPRGYALSMARAAGAPATGVIYYTLDGSDPRLPGGALSPSAIEYTGPVTLDAPATVRARMRNGTTWSAMTQAPFAIDAVPLRVTEIMYQPGPLPPASPWRRNDFEFIELTNVGPDELDLSGYHFTDGITFTFPDGTRLAPGAATVLVRNAAAFAERYGEDFPIGGVYAGGLNDAGEHLAVADAAGATVIDFAFSDAWRPQTDGMDYSLVPLDPAAGPDAWNTAAGWRQSVAPAGSPGAAEAGRAATVVGRHLYYNRSAYDGTVTVPDSSDDNALAPDKAALLPGGRAGAANVSSFTKGITGVFIDLLNLPGGAALTPADFEFRIGNTADPSAWALAPNPTVALRRGKGAGASDRVSLAWSDGVIRNTWLQVTVKANERTGWRRRTCSTSATSSARPATAARRSASPPPTSRSSARR